jgi:hypothetical protein
MVSLRDITEMGATRGLQAQADEPITVYPITVVKLPDRPKSFAKPPTYNYLDEETRKDAALNFLEDGCTIRYEDPYETDRGNF